MGERRNIELVYDGKHSIFLYTHWLGVELPQILATALDSEEGRARWDDDSYLARIIFSHMTKNASSPETGFGIAPYPVDMNYPNIRVDFDAKTVDGVPYQDYIETTLRDYNLMESDTAEPWLTLINKREREENAAKKEAK